MPFLTCFFCSLLIAQTVLGQINASTFPFNDSYTVRGTLTDIAVLNTNEDHLPDVIVTDFANDNINIFLNVGGCPNSIYFNKLIATGDSPVALAVADFNDNGRQDFAVLNSLSGSVILYESYFDSTENLFKIRSAGIYEVSASPQGILAKDIDADGKLDLITLHGNDGKINILHNRSSSGLINFESGFILTPGINLTSMYLDDMNGDGKADLLLGGISEGGHLLTYQNQSSPGNISFLSSIDQLISLSPTFLKTADLEGDGRKDIVLAGLSDHRLLLLHNTCSAGLLTTSSFTSPLYVYSSSHTGDLEIADLNEDGKPELIALVPAIDSLMIWTNVSEGEWNESVFLSPEKLTAGDEPIALTIADVNGDGKKDVLNTNHDFRNLKVQYQKNTTCGDVSFIPSAAVSYERYNAGDFVLTAFGSGLLNWYADSTLHEIVGIGIQYQTPWLEETDTFYVTNSVLCCESSPVKVIASIRCALNSPVPFSSSRCGSGPVELKAVSNDKVYWYKHALKDTSVIAQGPILSIQHLTQSDTFYAAAFKDGCMSKRTAVTATLFPLMQEKAVKAETGLCSSGGIALSISNSQKGMHYYVLENQTVHIYTGNGTFLSLGNYPVGTLLEVTASNICDSIVLPVVHHDLKIPVIPNLVTANEDGMNDFFFIQDLPYSSQLTIYNNWGTKVYSSEKYDNNWGAEAHSGIYFYELQYELCGTIEHRSGWIQVLKD